MDKDPRDERFSIFPESDGGSITLEESELLTSLVRNVKPLNIIETGTYRGASTLCLALGLQKNNLGGQIHTFDISTMFLDGAKILWEKYGVTSFINCINDRLWETLSFKIDLAFLDSDHTGDTTLREINTVLRFLNPGGIVVGHDTITFPAVAEVFKSKTELKNIFLNTSRGLVIAQKI